MNLFLSVHDDDSVLFGAFTCQRDHPLIFICLDSWLQPKRGEIGCDAKTRARETLAAHAYFRCETARLGFRDDMDVADMKGSMVNALLRIKGMFSPEVVYAPALQGGNIHHDVVSIAADAVFDYENVRHYTTYTKIELYTTGNIEIVPTERELELKNRALDCYESQLRLWQTRPHFEAVRGKSEWLM